MAISFEESLKMASTAKAASSASLPTIENSGISDMIAEPVTDYGIATLEEVGMVEAYSGEDGNWDQDLRYEVFPKFEDNNISFINDAKEITLHEKQFNITQEANSQYIPFEMPRFYDGYDLTAAEISIHYITKGGQHGASTPINVTFNNNKIRFGWLIDEGPTIEPGQLEFEIHAYGNIRSETGTLRPYVWKTRRNKDMNVLESLCDHNDLVVIDDTWMTELVTNIAERVAEEIAKASVNDQVVLAQEAATSAQESATAAKAVVTTAQTALENAVDAKIGAQIETALDDYSTVAEIEAKIAEVLKNYYTGSKVDELIEGIDISDQLKGIEDQIASLDGLANFDVIYDGTIMKFMNGDTVMKEITITSDPTDEWTEEYTILVEGKISDAKEDIQDDLDAYKEEISAYHEEISKDLSSIHESIDGLPETLAADYYTKTVSDEKFATKVELNDVSTAVNSFDARITKTSEDVFANTSDIGDLKIDLDSIDRSPRLKYTASYGEDYMYTLWEEYEDEEGNQVKLPVSSFPIKGGNATGGGSSDVESSTPQTIYVTKDDEVLISYKLVAPTGVLSGTAVWTLGGIVLETVEIDVDTNYNFDATPYLKVGKNDFKVSITDSSGSLSTFSWRVRLYDVYIDSDFDEHEARPLKNLEFTYTPYGALSKDVYFVLYTDEYPDGKLLGVETTTASGSRLPFTIPAQPYGSTLLKVYMTATIDTKTLNPDPIYKDIMWFDSNCPFPVIGCSQQNLTVKQYHSVDIVYSVYDPTTLTPTVVKKVDGVEVKTEKLQSNMDTWSFSSSEVGEHILTIECGETVKTIHVTVEELGVAINPVVTGLMFDFNPVGRSNHSEEDKKWSFGSEEDGTKIEMSVSPNFDWINGGYQSEEASDGSGQIEQFFCVKAGTTATIHYNLFADKAAETGKEFKIIFRTRNIKKRDTTFVTCMDGNIGLEMKIEEANVYFGNGNLQSLYCEDAVIEYEFNVDKLKDIPMVMSYEDGTPAFPAFYNNDSSFWQTTPQPITIGSPDCDVLIYRMKAYSRSLDAEEIKNNFIADARSGQEMVDRYNRNQIYDEDTGLLISTSSLGPGDVTALMNAAPDLRIIMLECPWFTDDKDTKISGCTVYQRYKNGRPEDNWTCTGVTHRGQGTSSNTYGYAGRNVDLVMDNDDSLFTWVDENGKTVESKTVTLTPTSVPTDYYNIKVNIASSENANNAQMARRFNEFQPYLRSARLKDSRVKDTMEFYNCVLFIRETDPDISKHMEFKDCDWHFYAIGNIGDSKKTDDTRVNDKNDPKECVVEIMDVDKPLIAFPTGKGDGVPCPVEEWGPGNSAYDILYSEYGYDKKGEFASFGKESFEFRYEQKNITDEQREENINTWRDFYKFVVTSTKEDFKKKLKEYFVVESALYYYLFTERYTMVDNRAKNSFWHYGKAYFTMEEAIDLGLDVNDPHVKNYIDDEQAAIRDGYRWDLTFGYDMDTCLGIDNDGVLAYSYGKEGTDYKVDGDKTSGTVFRAANSTFFSLIREAFQNELADQYRTINAQKAWNSNLLITQWDNSQKQFPEELWRLDFIRKYYRTYLGISVDNSVTEADRGDYKADPQFLKLKFLGRKKYQRRRFEQNQDLYYATRFLTTDATNNQIWFRANYADGLAISPDYSVTVTAYSDMYAGIQFGSTATPTNKRMKAGETWTFVNDNPNADFIYIFGASHIQEIGDLSRCYISVSDFSKATRLQKLILGSVATNEDGEVYQNNHMTSISLINNAMLEYLDIRNIPALSSELDLSGCGNLRTLYAQGTNLSSVKFADGGLLESAYLPKIFSLTAKNLSYLKDFDVDSYENLQSFVVENTPIIDTYGIVTNAIAQDPMNLVYLRLVGMDWTVLDAGLLDILMTLRGRTNQGLEADKSVMIGEVYIPVVKEQDLIKYTEYWPDLDISYGSISKQRAVVFKNANGDTLETQYVVTDECAVDISKYDENGIPVYPTLESSTQYDYRFSHWSLNGNKFDFSTKIRTAIELIAEYEPIVRTYTVRYLSKGIRDDEVYYEVSGEYGTFAHYNKDADENGVVDIPVYEADEKNDIFHLFKKWDKSGFIDGDKDVHAIFDIFEYDEEQDGLTELNDDIETNGSHTVGSFKGLELKDLSPVHLYALTKKDAKTVPLGAPDENGQYGPVQLKDEYTFVVGNDYEYEDIESRVLVSNKTVFNGTSDYLDTGISLFDVDRDFVLAIDYKFYSDCVTDGVLAQCYRTDKKSGFQLKFNGQVKAFWGEDSRNLTTSNKREMLVIRHQAGSKQLLVYNSSMDNDDPVKIELSRAQDTVIDSTLVFGCIKTSYGSYSNFASGAIYWSKIWYCDFEDEVCRDLAMWPHEKITLEMSGFNRYYLSDGSGLPCSISFLAQHLLDKTKTYKPSNDTSNVGGWEKSSLRTWMNKRLYLALPQQIRKLTKLVDVRTSAGGQSREIITTPCYITIPSYIDVVAPPNATTIPGITPYDGETSLESNPTIAYLTSDSTRIRCFEDGTANGYWLRSPDAGGTTYVWQIGTDGKPTKYNNPNSSMSGILIEISF